MQKIIIDNECNIPEWAICAIEYGNYSGLNEDDIKRVKDHIDNLQSHAKKISGNDKCNVHHCYSDNVYFSNRPEFGLPCNCVETEVIVLY